MGIPPVVLSCSRCPSFPIFLFVGTTWAAEFGRRKETRCHNMGLRLRYRTGVRAESPIDTVGIRCHSTWAIGFVAGWVYAQNLRRMQWAFGSWDDSIHVSTSNVNGAKLASAASPRSFADDTNGDDSALCRGKNILRINFPLLAGGRLLFW